MRYIVNKVTGELKETVSAGNLNFVGTIEEWNALTTKEKKQYKTADIIPKYMTEPAVLIFSSDGAFTLSVTTPGWDGIIEYSTDSGDNWSTWDGSELSGSESQPIYLRGSNNTYITGEDDSDLKFNFTGKYCTGNIETLLDYQTVNNGQHPTMESYCYCGLFLSCTALTVPPSLPATTLSDNCYNAMFYGCTSLTSIPALPATYIDEDSYFWMFKNCTSLKLSETQTEEYRYIFRMPTIGSGTAEEGALTDMFAGTGGTFTGDPEINTTYYTDHQPVE